MDFDSNVIDKMVLSLDVGDLDSALLLTKEVNDYFGYVKIGSELYAESGSDAVYAFQDLGKKIFLDLKIHDIPNTVERSLKAHAKRGIAMATVHAAGGKEMLIAARRGLDEGAREAKCEPAILLGVTVLTSLPADQKVFDERLSLIDQVGCDLVCSAHEVSQVKQKVPKVRALVPGIRLVGQDAGDQTRIATPYDAIKDGASWIVLGRAVYGSDDPKSAANEVASQVQKALSEI